MPILTTSDNVSIYYKDWGHGQPVVFCHGWPLSSDSWESQMLAVANAGYRAIAHDRRGHGRSSQPWDGNDMDHYADDLAAVINELDLYNVVLIGFSTGGGEVARYIGRHGASRVAKAVLVSSVPPLMVQRADNPNGVPKQVFDDIRENSLKDRSSFYQELASGPFFGFNRWTNKTVKGLVDAFWRQGMQAGHKNAYDSIAAFSETDFRGDLAKFNFPTLIIHGDDDQIVPIDVGGRASAKLIAGARIIEYAGAPHGITDTHKDQLSQDLIDFIRS